jgi:hypothetical protein
VADQHHVLVTIHLAHHVLLRHDLEIIHSADHAMTPDLPDQAVHHEMAHADHDQLVHHEMVHAGQDQAVHHEMVHAGQGISARQLLAPHQAHQAGAVNQADQVPARKDAGK